MLRSRVFCPQGTHLKDLPPEKARERSATVAIVSFFFTHTRADRSETSRYRAIIAGHRRSDNTP